MKLNLNIDCLLCDGKLYVFAILGSHKDYKCNKCSKYGVFTNDSQIEIDVIFLGDFEIKRYYLADFGSKSISYVFNNKTREFFKFNFFIPNDITDSKLKIMLALQ